MIRSARAKGSNAVRLFYDALAWLFLALMVMGFGGSVLASAYLQWTAGFDSGAPFSFAAGLRMFGFLSKYPLILVLGAVGGVGTVGLKLVAPHSTYAAKKKP